jgi:hypothetical protein
MTFIGTYAILPELGAPVEATVTVAFTAPSRITVEVEDPLGVYPIHIKPVNFVPSGCVPLKQEKFSDTRALAGSDTGGTRVCIVGAVALEVQPIEVTVIGPEISCPMFMLNIPEDVSTAPLHLKPEIAMHELVEPPVLGLKTPRANKTPITTATTTIAQPYVIRYSIADWFRRAMMTLLYVDCMTTQGDWDPPQFEQLD